MALQTREQHIKREKATSNICTAQALLATMAGFYAVYHGQEGITTIASRIHSITVFLDKQLKKFGYTQVNAQYFDTLRFELPEHVSAQQIRTIALSKEVNLRYFENGNVGFSIDETANVLLSIFAIAAGKDYQKVDDIPEKSNIDKTVKRTTPFLTHEVFNKYHTETEMMRYIKRLDRKDISLAQSMISLGSCTMKLNAAAEMLPLSRPEFMGMHPLVPEDQAEGYRELINNLSEDLKIITGFAGVSLQPNSGAAGEYTGLRVIRAYLESIGQGHRNKILIPASAHGTNPASAIQAGFITVTCACDEQGNVDMDDLRAKAEENKEELASARGSCPDSSMTCLPPAAPTSLSPCPPSMATTSCASCSWPSARRSSAFLPNSPLKLRATVSRSSWTMTCCCSWSAFLQGHVCHLPCAPSARRCGRTGS